VSEQWLRVTQRDRGRVEEMQTTGSNIIVSSASPTGSAMSISITVTEKANTTHSGEILEFEIEENEEDVIILRDIPEEEAEQLIRQYIDDNMAVGESLFPSDIAEALRLDYQQVYRVIEKLIAEDKVGWKE
jgi:hypothetical protein